MNSAEAIRRAEDYYRSISELTVARHREQLIKELLRTMSSLLKAVEEANARLMFSEARIRAIVNTAADGIITFDENGIIDTANPAAGRMFGLTPEDMSGKPVSSLLAGESSDVFHTTRARKLGAGYEDTARRGEETFPVYIAAQTMKTADRTYYVAIVRDITDQKQAESLLAQARAKEETDKILSAIDQGLFLIYRRGDDFEIGSQFSQATASILGADPGGKSFIPMIQGHVTESSVKTVRNYLDLMFKESVREDSLKALNPLSEIPFLVGAGSSETRTLQFTFRRVISEGTITHLMATVSDVTEETALKEQLKQREQQSRTQMEMLLKILHVDPAMLDEFIDETRLEMDLIDTVLKKESGDLRHRLEVIFRTAHKVKGNADLLGLSFFAEQMHSFEDTIEEILKRPEVSAADFIPLLFAFNKVAEIVEAIDGLVERLLEFRARFGQSSEDMILRSVRALVEKLGRELGKPCRLDAGTFQAADAPAAARKLTRDVLVQLIKNSLAHGIEDAETRRKKGKPAEASLFVEVLREHSSLFIRCRDDGQGLMIERLKQKAVEAGIAPLEEINSWPASRQAELIYATGLSTSLEKGMQSGRGVGMGMIRESVHEAGGTIRILSAPSRFFEVQIRIPI